MPDLILDTPDAIQFARMCALRGALRLECVGLKRRGRSAYAICKQLYGLRGSKARVLEQMTAKIEAELLLRESRTRG